MTSERQSPPGRPEPRAAIHLHRTDENVADIDEAVARLGRRVGIAGVLGHLNRQGARVPVPGRAVEWGFTWNASDAATRAWYPQGITTSADAGDREDLGGRRVLLTSWYSKRRGEANQGSRVTVVDLDTLEYRHVLLVVPRRRGGTVVLDPLVAHAGGLVWHGPYLHVAGTRRGLFTCLVDDLMWMDDASTTYGYRYVLPVRFGYDAKAEEGTEKMRYSFLSLDHDTDPPELLAGEYATGDQTRRLVRYPLDPASRHLACLEDGVSRPVWLDDRGVRQMQGAAVADGVYYVTTSHGPRRRGRLYVGSPGALRPRLWSLPPGPEDIAFWPATDRLWSLTEHPGRRFVFCIPRRRLHRWWHRRPRVTDRGR